MSKAYLNALAEEGTRQDLIDWLCKLDAENDRLRDALRKIADIETRLGVPAGLDMQSIAKAALKPIT